MNEILVHIGLHKTGTTWMQNEIFTSKNDTFEPLYIKDTLNGHSTLAHDFIFDSTGNLLSSFDFNTQEILNSYNKILGVKKKSDKVYVMSHERLSGHPTSSGFDASVIGGRIKEVFPSAKILIVIREQTSCISSNYFQYLKEGGVQNITKYLNTKYDGRRPSFGLNYFKYHFLIDFYQKKFGKKNVLVLPYELLLSNKNEFIKHIEAFIGQEIDTSKINFKKKYNFKENHFIDYHFRFLNNYIKSSSSLNSSTSSRIYQKKKYALKFKKYANKFISEKRNNLIKNRVSEEVNTWAKNKFEDSNKQVESLISINLEKFGYKL